MKKPSLFSSTKYRFWQGLLFLLMMSFKMNGQTCVSEKLTVRMISFSYSGTDIGGPDIRVIGTAAIGATTGTSACFGVDNIATFPVVPQPEFIVSAPVTCGATLPVVTVSYNAHEDNSIPSNCNVNSILGETLQQSALNIPVDISTIRSLPSHSITKSVVVGSGSTQWTVVFEVVWDNVVSICGVNAMPNDSKGYVNASAMNTAGGTEGCTSFQINPGTTFSQYATVKSDQYGTLGVVQYLSTTTTPATCSSNTRASRTGTEKLYLKDPVTGLCSGAIIPKTATGTNSGSFNPEWTNLTPNTDYIIFLTTTVDAGCTQYSNSCINYYGIPPMFPAGSVYNDDGKSNGTAGNCVREGGEDASTIPSGLFAKLKLNSSASASQAVAVQANGSFAFSGTIATGTYTVFLDNNSTLSDVTSTLPTNWSGTASWTGTITAGVLAPAFTGFCLKDVVLGPCSGNHYVQWSQNPWTTGSLTKNITLGGGLTMNTTITNPNGILAPNYPQMYAGIPGVLIQSNSSAKSITWTSVFNQKVSGVSFSIYDVDRIGTLRELVDIKGYNGAMVVNPIITKSLASFVTGSGTQVSGTINNIPTYSPYAKANISFNGPIDRIEINYRNNYNLSLPRPALLLVSDFSIYCPVAVNTPDQIALAKAAPTGNFLKGDTVTYTFRFNNAGTVAKTVDFNDVLPAGFTWVAGSYISPLTSTPNAYGGTNTFSMTGVSVPVGVTTFTIDAIANGAIGVNNNQASFTTNGNTYQSDDPNITGTANPTPVTLVAPPPPAPITMVKSIDVATVSQTGEVEFTYAFNNTNASAITVDFTDDLQPDSVRFKSASLVKTGASGGTDNAYANTGYLSITGLSIPAGSSTIKVKALMNSQALGTYENYASIIPKSGGFRQTPINSNSVNWTVLDPTLCVGNHYLQWSSTPWTAGSLTNATNLGGGLTMNTTILNPDNILTSGYPKMFADIPSLLIQTNSASKSITWSSTFTQKVSSLSFSIYDVDNVGTLKELLDIKGYNGATVVTPIITKPLPSSVVIAGTQISGTINNEPTYTPFAKANVAFNQPIDKVEINYRNNKNVFYPRPALLLVSDFSIYCPSPVTSPDEIDLTKAAPTGNFYKGDTLTYTFRFNNGGSAAKTVDFTDVLPSGFTWVANSHITPLTTTPNAYGGTNTFTMTGVSVPVGITTFTIDAIANGAIGVSNNQASFTTNGNTYQSDNPNTATAADATPVTLIAPPPMAPITVAKSVDLSSVPSTGEVKFTYTFNNTNASAITVDFSDDLQPDSVRFKPASLVKTGATGGTDNAYANIGYLSIAGLSIPAGSSTVSVIASMSGQPSGTYANRASILPTSGGFRQIPINSNNINWTVTSGLTFANPPASALNATPSEAKTGNAATELTPSGGTGPYNYSSGASDPACVAPVAATGGIIPVTVTPTGSYTYTAPATPGMYYYCIKVCDSTPSTPICSVKVYQISVAATCTEVGGAIPGLK
jgi:uncharacterized repeat protein (TIGR01451 family)